MAFAAVGWIPSLNLEIGDYIWFLLAVTLVAGVSFIDDIHSLPDSVRLVAQFGAMLMMFYQLDILHLNMWWVVILTLIVCVGASNIINFMDGVNGITEAYALASLIPMALLNQSMDFVNQSLIFVVILADMVFCYFNFRPKGKAKCFAGDVGSIGVAYILLFLIGALILRTGDITWLIFLLVYGVDGCLTICHRIMLHESLGEAHRKHAYQIMANELKIESCEGGIALRVAAAGGVSRIHLYYSEYSSSALALSAWGIDCSKHRLHRIHEEVLSSA